MISQQYIDPLQVVYEYLVMQTPQGVASVLYPLTATRVYIDSDPKDLVLAACIVIRQPGGTDLASAAVNNPVIQLDCYGGSDNPQAARAVTLAATYQLHRARAVETATGVLLSAIREGGGSVIPTPEGVRPFIPVYFRVLTRP